MVPQFVILNPPMLILPVIVPPDFNKQLLAVASAVTELLYAVFSEFVPATTSTVAVNVPVRGLVIGTKLQSDNVI